MRWVFGTPRRRGLQAVFRLRSCLLIPINRAEALVYALSRSILPDHALTTSTHRAQPSAGTQANSRKS